MALRVDDRHAPTVAAVEHLDAVAVQGARPGPFGDPPQDAIGRGRRHAVKATVGGGAGIRSVGRVPTGSQFENQGRVVPAHLIPRVGGLAAL
jgi:hypothetical protein